MYKQIAEYKLANGVKFKVFMHIDADIYVLTSDHHIDTNCASQYGGVVVPGRMVSKPINFGEAWDTLKEYAAMMGIMDVRNTFGEQNVKNTKEKKEQSKKPVLYTDFSKMDPNDPLIKAMEKRRPYCSSDFIPKMMIPDLRTKRK